MVNCQKKAARTSKKKVVHYGIVTKASRVPNVWGNHRVSMKYKPKISGFAEENSSGQVNGGKRPVFPGGYSEVFRNRKENGCLVFQPWFVISKGVAYHTQAWRDPLFSSPRRLVKELRHLFGGMCDLMYLMLGRPGDWDNDGKSVEVMRSMDEQSTRSIPSPSTVKKLAE